MARLYELANELGIPNKDLIVMARRLRIRVQSHMSYVDEEDARKLRGEVECTGSTRTAQRAAGEPEVVYRRTITPTVIHRRGTTGRGATTHTREATMVEYFVDNLPNEIDDVELARGLAELGSVTHARVLRRPRDGSSLGCGYVRFRHELAETALREVRRWGRDLIVVRAHGSSARSAIHDVPVPPVVRRNAASVAPTRGAHDDSAAGEWIEIAGNCDTVLIRHGIEPSRQLVEQLQRRERAGDVMGGQLSTEIVDKLGAASAIVAGGLNAGNVFQIVGSPGLLSGLQSGSLTLMRTKGGLLGTVVSSSSGRIAGQARFLPASMAPVLAPVLVWQVLHGIAGTSQLRKINLRLDMMTRQLERLQTRQDARLLGEVHAAKEALDSILAERATTGRFTTNMAINLTLLENTVNAVLAGNVVLTDLLRRRADELQRDRSATPG